LAPLLDDLKQESGLDILLCLVLFNLLFVSYDHEPEVPLLSNEADLVSLLLVDLASERILLKSTQAVSKLFKPEAAPCNFLEPFHDRSVFK
jgi:hypothetical protein